MCKLLYNPVFFGIRLAIALLIVFHSWSPAVANPKQNYDEAYEYHLAAAASMAAYNERISRIVRQYLVKDGWELDYYTQKKGARFFIAQKLIDDKAIYLVSVVGTERWDDIKLDLMFGQVYFAGKTMEEFAANAAMKMPSSAPKVHRGFNYFVQSGIVATLEDSHHAPLNMADILRSNPQARLYLTGHSLGGAAATIGAARLIDVGISPEQIKVITFGAPAVGNLAFTEKFSPVMPLKRIVNRHDPVVSILQSLSGKYKQFGQEVRWTPPDTVGDPHMLSGYVDSAIKNYYDKRRAAINSGVEVRNVYPLRRYPATTRVLPLEDRLPPGLANEFTYMRESYDYPYKLIPDSSSSSKNADLIAPTHFVDSSIEAIPSRDQPHAYQMIFTRAVRNANGITEQLELRSTGTFRLTPLAAFLYLSNGD